MKKNNKLSNKWKVNNKPSAVQEFRNKWYNNGYELIDITPLCEVKMGNSGWGNDFHEPEQNIYHTHIMYRNEYVLNCYLDKFVVLDDERFVVMSGPDKSDGFFIIFRKVKLTKKEQNEYRP